VKGEKRVKGCVFRVRVGVRVGVGWEAPKTVFVGPFFFLPEELEIEISEYLLLCPLCPLPIISFHGKIMPFFLCPCPFPDLVLVLSPTSPT
jgi:hypothetical protein